MVVGFLTTVFQFSTEGTRSSWILDKGHFFKKKFITLIRGREEGECERNRSKLEGCECLAVDLGGWCSAGLSVSFLLSYQGKLTTSRYSEFSKEVKVMQLLPLRLEHSKPVWGQRCCLVMRKDWTEIPPPCSIPKNKCWRASSSVCL